MPTRNRFAVKPSCMLSRDMPENAAHAETEPLQVVVELEPLPRLTWRYSAVIDHAPFNPISVPPPAAQPVDVKFLPPLNEAVGFVAPTGVKMSVLVGDPLVMIVPTRKYGSHRSPA